MTGPTRRSVLSTLGGFAAAVGVTGVTSGQSTTETVTETDDGTTYAAQVSETVRLVDYELTRSGSGTPMPDSDSSGSTPTGTATFALIVECDTPSLLTTTDGFAGLSSEGVTEVEQEQTTVPSGRSELRREVTTLRGQAAIGLSAPNGVVRISTGLPSTDDNDGVFDGQPGWGTVRLAGISAATGAIGAVGTEAYRRRNGGRSEVNRKA